MKPKAPLSGRFKAWKTLRSTPLLNASPWLRVHQDELLLPSGRVEPSYLRVWMPSFSLAVPLARDGRVVMLRHYKHGAGRVIWGLPAGHLEPREKPLAAARRELKEETGYAAPRWTPLGSFVCNANRGCGTGHYFLAEGAVLRAKPVTDDLEECEVVLLEPRQAWGLLEKPGELSMAGAAALGLAFHRLSGRRR